MYQHRAKGRERIGFYIHQMPKKQLEMNANAASRLLNV